ncbi:outer membrane protein assembly factor BamE domain-containing protein [Hymenobacter agri]
MLMYWLSGFAFSLLLFTVLLFSGLSIQLGLPHTHIRRQRLWLNLLSSWTIACLCVTLVLWLLYRFNNPTQYASNYSESNFQEVTVGMSEQQVVELLGSPLAKWEPYQYSNYINRQHYIGYTYSRSESGEGDYEVRQINFDRGKVAEVRHYRYYD